MVRITQLSDTHFLEEGATPEGGHAYDTDAAFDAVLDHHEALRHPDQHPGEHEDGGTGGGGGDVDLVVVTGDVADHGRPAQYRKAADAFSRFGVPVNVCPGNHDLTAPFGAGVGRPGVATSRVVEVGSWAFLFVDSSAGLMVADEAGHLLDPQGETRLHNNGALGAREAAWIRSTCDHVRADHVFIWLHHPPSPTVPLSYDAAYAAEWETLLADLPTVRGLGGGHTHVPVDYEVAGRPVFVAPSLKNNFSMDPQTWLPPGYRTYDFTPDGTVTSEVHLVDDERWPRRPFGRTLRSLFDGEITFEELAQIAAQRR